MSAIVDKHSSNRISIIFADKLHQLHMFDHFQFKTIQVMEIPTKNNVRRVRSGAPPP